MKTFLLASVIPLMTFSNATLRAEDNARDTLAGITLLPGSVLFSPLVASAQEPRTGLRKEIGSSRMKLDIGTTMDLLQYDSFGEYVWRLGIDFFTYALSTSNRGLRLQIAAVDGFFGGHITWSPRTDIPGVRLRLRLLHVSAHLIDGSYDTETGLWRNNRLPIPYTRDFGELVVAWSNQRGSVGFRVYSGFSYATLVRPSTVKRFTLVAGGEVHSTGFPGSFLGSQSAIYLAYHFLLSGTPVYAGGNAIEAGIKIGEWHGSGVRFSLSYEDGPEIFSQFYDLRRTAWGLGFAFDFW